MLKKQMMRLFRAKIHYSWDDESESGGEDDTLASKYRLWWGKVDGADDDSSWESHVDLNAKMFADITARPLPLDLDAVRCLKGSPLALDLYGWLAYRVHQLERPVRVPWVALHRQVGSTYRDVANFKKKAKSALRNVHMFWPALNYRTVPGGVLVMPSRTPIPQLSA